VHLHRSLDDSVDIVRRDQTQPSGPIDWSAEDEHDLPPISGLQESFGGETQPTPTVVDDQVPPPQDDGFATQSGRGRGFRGERRGGRGGYRGEGGGRGYGRGGSYGDRGGRGCEWSVGMFADPEADLRFRQLTVMGEMADSEDVERVGRKLTHVIIDTDFWLTFVRLL